MRWLALGRSRETSGEGRSRAWLIGVLVVAVAKLVLVADHEIVAGNYPHDDYWQIISASFWHWRRPYDVWTLMHLPVYPGFIALAGTIGLPLRLAIELLHLAGAAALSSSLGRLGLAPAMQLTAFVLIAWHPYTFGAFDFARATTLYGCLLLFLVALFVRLVVARSPREFRWSAVLFACTSALLWHCRKESILISGLLGIVGAGILTAFVSRALTRAEAWRLAIVIVAVPIGAALALGQVIRTANGVRYGLWHTDQMTAPNFVRAYASLQAIRPDHPIRFVPVTRDARQKAYAVSPAFRELQPMFEGPREAWYMTESKRWLGLPGEIGAGWFYGALFDAAAAAGHFKTARGAEAFFGRVADEITAAVKDGRVPSRRVLFSYIDPAVSLWLPSVPGSFVRLAASLWPSQPPPMPGRPTGVPARVVADFDAVARRRVPTVRPTRYAVEGWALASSSRPIRVDVIDGWETSLGASFEPRARPDVPVMRGPSGHPGPAALGFRLSWATALAPADMALKVALESNQATVTGPLSSLTLKKKTRADPTRSDDVVFLTLDRIERRLPDVRSLVGDLVSGWYPVFLSLVIVAVAARLVLAVAGGRVVLHTHTLVVLLFVLAIVVLRLGFFAVLDASAWTANLMFYQFPIAAPATVVPVVAFALGRPRSTSAAP